MRIPLRWLRLPWLGARMFFLALAWGMVESAVRPALLAAEPLVPAVECRERGGLSNVFAKLQVGGEVRIAYLGGSITAQEGWRVQTLQWFQSQHPNAKVQEINAAIGGTGSDLGVFRLKHDVLDKHPDLLFVEFAVNDAGAEPAQIHRCIEGIVRQTWKADPFTDICFVYTLTGDMLETLQRGEFPRAASAMEKVADHYRIPSVHMGVEVARLEKAGRLLFKGKKPTNEPEKQSLGGRLLFSPDSVHPYPESGHKLYFEAVVRSMAKIQAVPGEGRHALRQPLVADNWVGARMIPLSGAKLSAGWQRLDPQQDGLARTFGDRLPEVWKSTKPGESISFRCRGTYAYIYDLVGPDCGQVSVVVDGAPPKLAPRFDSFCTYHRLAQLAVLTGASNTVHTITLTIHPDQPDKAQILSQRGERIDDSKRYDGTAWYAGAILLVGELVE